MTDDPMLAAEQRAQAYTDKQLTLAGCAVVERPEPVSAQRGARGHHEEQSLRPANITMRSSDRGLHGDVVLRGSGLE